MVDEVVAPDEVYAAARRWAEQFVNGAARALAAAKAAIDGGLDGDLANGLKLESSVFAGLLGSEDRTIGMRSFLEHGPGKAKFTGR
jgi:enoyl-CoA hydratase